MQFSAGCLDRQPAHRRCWPAAYVSGRQGIAYLYWRWQVVLLDGSLARRLISAPSTYRAQGSCCCRDRLAEIRPIPGASRPDALARSGVFATSPYSGLMKVNVDRALVGAAVLVCIIAGIGAMNPGGAVRTAWREHQMRRNVAEMLSGLTPGFDSIVGTLGNVAGSDTIIEFADYECPYCRQGEPIVVSWLALHPQTTLLYINLPLPIHPQALGAAKATICAGRLGRFREMHRELMSTLRWERDSDWIREGVASGIHDPVEFAACLKGRWAASVVRRGETLAREVAVVGTPTFFGLRGRVEGVPDTSALTGIK